MQVRLVWITPDAEKLIAYCARVSNPENQENENFQGLLKYCIKHGHWSIFEMANMCVEIITSRAISAQLLRHKSFSFQEFSQRYAESTEFEDFEIRRQDLKNRQNSIDDLPEHVKMWYDAIKLCVKRDAETFYTMAIERGIAKECARMLLPMCTQTKLYMNGDIRSWIHYLNLRCGNGTQKEHMEIAEAVKEIFTTELPIISEALQWI